MGLRTKFSLCEKTVLTTFNGVPFLHPLFVQNWVRLSHHSYAVQARSQGRWHGSWSWHTIYQSGILTPTCQCTFQGSIYFKCLVVAWTRKALKPKMKAPRRMIFTHHLPEALQNYFNCAKISTKKRSHQSVKMVLSSFGRMPDGCSTNRLCYGSIFYSLFAFDYSLPPSSNLFKSSFWGFKIIFYTYFIVIKWICE